MADGSGRDARWDYPKTESRNTGGVVSSLLATLFLHYSFDAWMRRTFPRIPFEYYADEPSAIAEQAEHLKAALEKRLAECHLMLHPQKIQVV